MFYNIFKNIERKKSLNNVNANLSSAPCINLLFVYPVLQFVLRENFPCLMSYDIMGIKEENIDRYNDPLEVVKFSTNQE